MGDVAKTDSRADGRVAIEQAASGDPASGGFFSTTPSLVLGALISCAL